MRVFRTRIVLLVIVLLFVLPNLSQAASGISITNLSFVEGGGCQYVSVSVQVSDIQNTDPPASIQVFKNGSQVGSATPELYPSGTFTQGFVVDAVSGDSITVNASIGGINTSAGPIVCGGIGNATSGASGAGGGVSGPPDSRLNYTPDEYYAVYCAFDTLEIWRGVPSGLLLHAVPLNDLLGLGTGANYIVGGGTSIVRDSDDGFTVYGSNGNLAPQPGSKGFSMADCLSRNGGAPQPDSPTGGQSAAPPPEPLPVCEDPATRNARVCFTSELDWCIATNYADPACTQYNFSRFLGALVESVFQCFMAMTSLTAAGLVFVVPYRRRLKVKD